mmetsp:Transcript_8648/g.23025  ORF Transcript_8648/g.23025 Transcript_8648/m.23025 type:complete len:80 (-) Transcript_8648:715-954(-)
MGDMAQCPSGNPASAPPPLTKSAAPAMAPPTSADGLTCARDLLRLRLLLLCRVLRLRFRRLRLLLFSSPSFRLFPVSSF